ncbi:MAG: hypothetical protein HRF45_06440 [Fimbriimonadia bacterium]|jgi:hypothetical protein
MTDSAPLRDDLLQAMADEGCPVCTVIRAAAHRRIESQFHELVNDGDFRARLRRSGGLCPEHCEDYIRLGDPLGLSIIAKDLLESEARQLGRGQRKPRRCPACADMEDHAKRTCADMARLLARPDWQERYSASSGLCMLHVAGLLRFCDAPTAVWVCSIEISKMDALAEALDLVIRHHDYRFQSEPWGDEVGSWKQALRKLCGQPRTIADEERR